jgi:hypothetical protein
MTNIIVACDRYVANHVANHVASLATEPSTLARHAAEALLAIDPAAIDHVIPMLARSLRAELMALTPRAEPISA